MTDTDVLDLDAALRELREGLRRMELRAEQHDATIQTLTRQMAQQDIEHQDRLAKVERRLDGIEQRLTHIEKLLIDIAQKLGA